MTLTLLRVCALTAALVLCGAPAVSVQAQQPPASQDGFVPIDQLGDVKEELPATPFVTAAYSIAWLAVFVYVWSIWTRLRRVEKELAEVNRRIQRGATP